MLSRVTRLWCGHCGMTSRSSTTCANKHRSTAQSNACALSGMQQDDCQHRSVLYHLRLRDKISAKNFKDNKDLLCKHYMFLYIL